VQLLINGLAIARLCDGWRERSKTIGWLAIYALLRRFRRNAGRMAIRTARYRGLLLTLDWLAAEHVPLREVLVRHEYWPSPSWLPSAGQTVVDVGANAGIFTVASARLVGRAGRVVAIEPNPAVLGRLRRNVRQNGFDDTVVVLPLAIGRNDGRGLVLDESGNSTVARVHVLAIGDLVPREAVAVTSLDEALARVGAVTVHLLKVDVEGLERSVLEGASAALARCRRAVVEVGSDTDAVAIEALFRAAGLSRVTRRSAGRDSRATLLFAERPESGL
jgi:FkbM family methyltransferase